MTPHHDPGTPGVIARWATASAPDRPSACGECGQHLNPDTTQCPGCRQTTAGPATGRLAVVIETTAGERRLLIAERTPAGGWAPTRHLPATADAVAALARQDRTKDGAA